MSVITGIQGFVNDRECTRGWSINHTADLQPYVCSASQGGTGRVDGNKDWTGNYSAYGHTPDVMPGESFTFMGVVSGVAGPATVGAEGTARVDQVEITWDIEAGAIIAHTVNFSSNGALSLGVVDSSGHTESVPNPVTAVGTSIDFFDEDGASDSTLDALEVRTVTLTITCDNKSYVGSGTPGVTKRAAGNIDFTVSFTVYVDDFSDLPALNLVRELRINVDATNYWLLKWVMFGNNSGLEVDREGASLVGATCNGSMNGFTEVSGTPTVGEITGPGGSPAFWP